jgi:hypothetical protein
MTKESRWTQGQPLRTRRSGRRVLPRGRDRRGLGRGRLWWRHDRGHRSGRADRARPAAGVHLLRGAGALPLDFDVLVIAVGARPREALPGALTFAGEESRRAFRSLLDELDPGGIERLVFAVREGTLWPLPLYELALMTATYAAARCLDGVQITPVTPKPLRPVLRGLLLTGNTPGSLRADLRGGQGEASEMDMEPLWWPRASSRATTAACTSPPSLPPSPRPRAAFASRSTTSSRCSGPGGNAHAEARGTPALGALP